MKQFIAAVLITGSAYAVACTTQTFIVNGKVTTCTTCGNVTSCY
jgi:hypothetical protein